MSQRSDITVAGIRFDGAAPYKGIALPGKDLESIVMDALQAMRREGRYTRAQARELMRYSSARVNGIVIPRKDWADTVPPAGACIEIRRGLRGGGGGGKGGIGAILGIIAIIGAAIVAPIVGPALAAGLGVFEAATWTGIVAGGFMLLGAAANMLFPAAQPKLSMPSVDSKQESPTYSISGARNAANIYGYVPLVLGKHRHTPPLAAKNWTSWEGDDQFFHMCVVWGHAHMNVSDFRIGQTTLDNFRGVEHVFHASTTGDDLELFGKSYNEQSVGAVIKQAEGWTTRSIGEAEDISIDLAFQNGLCNINKQNGNSEGRTIQVEMQYAETGSDTWNNIAGGVVDIYDDKLKYRVKNYRITGLEKKNYDVRIRRITADTNSQYIKDECTWSAVRAIVNRPAFNTPVPLCVSELRIRASDQLSQFIDDFNGLAVSVVPDWDEASEEWVEKETSNPASLARFCITSRAALSKPYSLAKLDDTAWQEFWRYCDEHDYQFNFICDSEEAFWQRMTEILAPGRGGLVVNEGRFLPAIDRTGLVPVQMFTPRNSWGMKVSRDFYDLPHALRVSFVDETRDYEQQENFVYADGYDAETATNIIEWDFPGITSWERIWRQGRYYLAKLLQRPLTLTFSTDWEWLACRRGDLVGIASPVLLNTFGTARIDALLYEVDGQRVAVRYAENAPMDEDGNPLSVIGVRLDDTVIFSRQGRYGIAIRDNAGKLTVYEVQPKIGSETADMVFMAPLSAGNTPEPDQLVSVSILGDEYAEYLVAAIRPGEKLTAEITCIPYNAEEIEAATEGEVPPWEPPIYLPGISGDKLPQPSIMAIRSDESMLVRNQSGGSSPQIGVWWQLPSVPAEPFNMQAIAVFDGTQSMGSAGQNDDFVTIGNVVEGEVYSVRVRIVSAAGKTSPWSAVVRHRVVGRTTPPPQPSVVYLDGYVLKIEQSLSPLDVVGHEIWMAFDEHDPFGYALKISTPYVTDRKFDLSAYAGRARQVFVRTVDEIGLTSEPVRLVVNLGDIQPNNVLIQISERDDNVWHGELDGGFISGNALLSKTKTSLWQQDQDAVLWQNGDTSPLWATGIVDQLVYAWTIDIRTAYAGARVLVLPEIITGKLRALEMRNFQIPNLWPDDASALWPGGDDALLWPQPVGNEWRAFSSDYVTPGSEIVEFRLTMSPEGVAYIADILTILDMKDREWSLEDVDVPTDGTYAEIPEGYFRAITNVTFGMQYRDGLTAVSVCRVPENNPPVDKNGYLTRGPMIRAYTADNLPGTASVDIRMKGY
ncbi:TipJ family phage tail tip protein [Desulfovibrio piger]|uniref:TipJ family phage tail tip protein n=1 Tax=Desulfovibrio piger TaxID=901 RepID=UPI0026F2B9BE|nr:phage tail protein [Desulfovibrio piger]